MLKKPFSILIFTRRLLTSQNSTSNWITQDKRLMEPFDYVQKLPCKHHILIAPAFNYWLQVPEEKLEGIQQANRAWVTWSILLDDIQDDSLFRYGMPAAHRVFGVGATISAANETLILVQKQMMELGNPLAPKKFINRIEQFIYSQGIDLYWQDKNIIPTEEEHIHVTRNKAGSYFALPVDLLQLFSSNETDYTDLAINIGSYYELLDDYYNLLHPQALQRLANEKQENHGINSDITEGKITLSIIHASQFPDVATELADILKQRTSDPKLQNRVIELVKKHGSDEYTRNKLKKFEADIRAQIDQLGGNPKLTAYLDELSFQNHKPAPEKELYS